MKEVAVLRSEFESCMEALHGAVKALWLQQRRRRRQQQQAVAAAAAAAAAAATLRSSESGYIQ
jgi:hypothetical protein